MNYSMYGLVPADNPKIKFKYLGPMQMTDAELLSILIQTGTKKRNALEIARQVLDLCNGNLIEMGKLTIRDLMGIEGIGYSKAVAVMAALEISRRRHASQPLERSHITNSQSIANYLKSRIGDLSYEVFAVVFLNRSNHILSFEIVSKGGITGTVADARLILKKAVQEEACALVLCHNHPSGALRPSRADEELTIKIREAARFFDIRVLDHVIVSTQGYYSFADEGLI